MNESDDNHENDKAKTEESLDCDDDETNIYTGMEGERTASSSVHFVGTDHHELPLAQEPCRGEVEDQSYLDSRSDRTETLMTRDKSQVQAHESPPSVCRPGAVHFPASAASYESSDCKHDKANAADVEESLLSKGAIRAIPLLLSGNHTEMSTSIEQELADKGVARARASSIECNHDQSAVEGTLLGKGLVRTVRFNACADDSQYGSSSDATSNIYDEYDLGDFGVASDIEFGHLDQERRNLAVARLVCNEDTTERTETDRDDLPLPSAVEYDPDVKPAKVVKIRQEFQSYVLLSLFLVAAIGVGLALVWGRFASKGSYIDDHLDFRNNLGIKEMIVNIVGNETLDDYNSAHAKALRWIMYEDKLELLPDNTTIFQRYATASFYFATSTDHKWRYCNRPADSDESDLCDYMENPFDAGSRTAVKRHGVRWLSSFSECTWAGVTCDTSGQIVKIVLAEANMTGTFPLDVKYLPFLKKLDITGGSLKGELPAELPIHLRHLHFLRVSQNHFTGTIPLSWWNWHSLVSLHVGFNSLTGKFPGDQITSFGMMKHLSVASNKISGPLPTEMNSFKSLSKARFGDNSFTGTIPSTLGNMRLVKVLELHGNQFAGTIPTEIARLTSLSTLKVNGNWRILGEIPKEVYSLSNLVLLDLSNCNLTGTIGTEIGQLKQLRQFGLNGNDLSGAIPSEIGQLQLLLSLRVENNNLRGQIPANLCRNNVFSGFLAVADCKKDRDTGLAAVECDCCTICCAVNSQECYEEMNRL